MKIYQVDAFTDQPFKGNPAGVCLVETARPDGWMQSAAQEMNLSETAFVLPQSDGFQLRWFTPKREVSLCGHATLATAHVLWEEQRLQPAEEVRFHTKSGLLTAKRQGDLIALDFPSRFAAPCEEYPTLNRALGITPTATLKSTSPRGDIYLLQAASEQVVRALTPNHAALAECGIRSVIVTSRSDGPDYDFVSRYFAPGVGVTEDPVTGAAHCYLAPYWGAKLDRKTLVGFQASERTGVVVCTWDEERVILRGKAVTVFKGEWVA